MGNRLPGLRTARHAATIGAAVAAIAASRASTAACSTTLAASALPTALPAAAGAAAVATTALPAALAAATFAAAALSAAVASTVAAADAAAGALLPEFGAAMRRAGLGVQDAHAERRATRAQRRVRQLGLWDGRMPQRRHVEAGERPLPPVWGTAVHAVGAPGDAAHGVRPRRGVRVGARAVRPRERSAALGGGAPDQRP